SLRGTLQRAADLDHRPGVASGWRNFSAAKTKKARRSELFLIQTLGLDGVPTGIRTPVATVKELCPRPLDDGDLVVGGANRDRTDDLYNAIVALSQLSYSPTCWKEDNVIDRFPVRQAFVKQ